MKTAFKAATLAFAMAMTSCATTVTLSEPSRSEKDYPALNEVAKAYVGDRMLYQASLLEGEGMTILEDAAICNALVREILVSKGSVFSKGLGSDGEIYYCGDTIWNNKFEGTKTDYVACFTILPSGLFKTRIHGSCSEPVKYELGTYVRAEPDNLQKTLMYSGKSGSVIYLSYREFSGDMARPAFTQDLTFDISTDNVVGAKGALIEILNASNTSVEYRVISTFK